MSTCNILMFTCDIYVNMQHNYVDTHVFVFLNLGRRLTLNWGQISAPFPKTKSDVFSPLYFQKFPICFYILILKSFFKSNSKMKTFQERELIFQDQNLFQRKYQFVQKEEQIGNHINNLLISAYILSNS